MSVRTYNPSVRVGNWNEDIQLEEDTLRDFLERKERGELLIQQSASFKESANQQCSLSVSRDGMVHFGDTVMIVNAESKDGSRQSSALSITGTGVTASCATSPSSRNIFNITSMDGSTLGEPLHYGQSFYIANAAGNMLLQSDRATFGKCAKKSRHNEVALVNNPSHLTEWKILSFDPLTRMETEFQPCAANVKSVLSHVKTNNNLCNESAHSISTPFGKEYEVSTFTSLDSHKAETDDNHWIIAMNVPGDSSMGSVGPSS